MTLCPWCGQQTASDAVCDWCKRPIDRKITPPVGARNDLDFLKEEGDSEKSNIIRWGLVGVCAIACGVALFFFFRGSNPAPDSSATASGDAPPPKRTSVSVTPAGAQAKLVSLPQMAEHRPQYWIDQWNNGADLISNAGASWTKAAPMARGTADVQVNVPLNSPVKLENVTVTMVTLANGEKRAVGSATIANNAGSNVIDYRIELVWADKDYTMMPLEGTTRSLHQVYYKALRPGKKQPVQLVSLKIKSHPDGTPNTLRLTAWLDGNPGTAIDEYPIQFGH